MPHPEVRHRNTLGRRFHYRILLATLADGNIAVEVPEQHRHDEIGEMAKAVQVFRTNMLQTEKLVAEQAAERLVKDRRAAHLETLVQNFEARATQLVGMLSSVQPDC
jgi:methyl-accepting chemotaxis protein